MTCENPSCETESTIRRLLSPWSDRFNVENFIWLWGSKKNPHDWIVGLFQWIGTDGTKKCNPYLLRKTKKEVHTIIQEMIDHHHSKAEEVYNISYDVIFVSLDHGAISVKPNIKHSFKIVESTLLEDFYNNCN